METLCNGKFLDKEPDEALKYLDHLVENSQAWHGTNLSENSISLILQMLIKENITLVKKMI